MPHRCVLWTRSALVQVMSCLLFGPKPLPEPLSISHSETNFSKIRIEIQNFSFMKLHLKMSPVKWRPFCPEKDELNYCNVVFMFHDIIDEILEMAGYDSHGKSTSCSTRQPFSCLWLVNNTHNLPRTKRMMTTSNGNIFRVTGPLCGEFTGHRWIPLTKASDAELWCFLRSAPEQTVE